MLLVSLWTFAYCYDVALWSVLLYLFIYLSDLRLVCFTLWTLFVLLLLFNLLGWLIVGNWLFWVYVFWFVGLMLILEVDVGLEIVWILRYFVYFSYVVDLIVLITFGCFRFGFVQLLVTLAFCLTVLFALLELMFSLYIVCGLEFDYFCLKFYLICDLTITVIGLGGYDCFALFLLVWFVVLCVDFLLFVFSLWFILSCLVYFVLFV